MKRCSLVILVITFCAALGCAQDGPSSDQVFSSDLIAWSGMQQLQAPEQPGRQTAPTPSAQTAWQNSAGAPDQQQTPPDVSANDPQNQTPAASSFTGTITQEAGGFVLKVSATTSYKLDAQRQVEQYEGQRVRLTGTLEMNVNVMHVDRIEPLS